MYTHVVELLDLKVIVRMCASFLFPHSIERCLNGVTKTSLSLRTRLMMQQQQLSQATATARAIISLNITINDDSIFEGDESFVVSLDGSDPATQFNPDSLTVTIVDGDSLSKIEKPIKSIMPCI